MIHQRAMQPVADGHARTEASDLVAIFLVAWEEAVTSYGLLVSKGIAADDPILARDYNYARLLKAGQSIHWVGGAGAVKTAAQMIARQVPCGALEHFDRLWCGLLPKRTN
jgi:hypothetical protein